MSRTDSRSRWPWPGAVSVRASALQMGRASRDRKACSRALPACAIRARTSSQRLIALAARSCMPRTWASRSAAVLRAAAMAAVVASMRASTADGAADCPAWTCVAVHVARIVSSCSRRCWASAARRVRVSLSAASRERITFQESVRLASVFSDGDDRSACAVVTRCRPIHSSAAASSTAMSSSCGSAEVSSTLRRRLATCSARWATSGTGIGVIVGAVADAGWVAGAAGGVGDWAAAGPAAPNIARTARTCARTTSVRPRRPPSFQCRPSHTRPSRLFGNDEVRPAARVWVMTPAGSHVAPVRTALRLLVVQASTEGVPCEPAARRSSKTVANRGNLANPRRNCLPRRAKGAGFRLGATCRAGRPGAGTPRIRLEGGGSRRRGDPGSRLRARPTRRAPFRRAIAGRAPRVRSNHPSQARRRSAP